MWLSVLKMDIPLDLSMKRKTPYTILLDNILDTGEGVVGMSSNISELERNCDSFVNRDYQDSMSSQQSRERSHFCL